MIRYGGLLCLLVSQIAFAQGPDAGTVIGADAGTTVGADAGTTVGADAETVAGPGKGTSGESRVMVRDDGRIIIALTKADRDSIGADLESFLKSSDDLDVQEIEQAEASRVEGCLNGTEEDTEFCSRVWTVCLSNIEVTACSGAWEVLRADIGAAPDGEGAARRRTSAVGAAKRMISVGGEPEQKQVPAVVADAVKQCIDDVGCTDLWRLKESKGDAYRFIRLWCDKNEKEIVRKQESVANVCDAIDEYHGDTGREEVNRRWKLEAAKSRMGTAEERFRDAVANLEELLTRTHLSDDALRNASQALQDSKRDKIAKRRAAADARSDLATASPTDLPARVTRAKSSVESFLAAARDTSAKRREYLKLTAERPEVERARQEVRSATKELEAARAELEAARAADEESARQLRSVDRYELLRFQDKLNGPIYSCGGWGLVLPLFSARKPAGAPWDVKGPVTSGVGGGYYFDRTCDADSSWGLSLFGYTEGLDPGEKLHFAVGASVSITAFKYFGFGVGFGYDLFRHTPATADAPARTTGLFPDFFRPDNFSLLFTFSLKSESETKDEETTGSSGGSGTQ